MQNRSTLFLFTSLFAFAAGALACDSSEAPTTKIPTGDNNCPTACTGDQICGGTTCQNAFPGIYEITIETVTFAQRDKNGNCWDDPACGAPDPQVNILLGGNQVKELDTDDNMYSATFNQTAEIALSGPTQIQLQLVDEDIDSNDIALECAFNPLTAENIRNSDLSCMSGGNMISARIDLKSAIPTTTSTMQ